MTEKITKYKHIEDREEEIVKTEKINYKKYSLSTIEIEELERYLSAI